MISEGSTFTNHQPSVTYSVEEDELTVSRPMMGMGRKKLE